MSTNDTFTPQVNPRRVSNGNSGKDSLDRLATEVSSSSGVVDLMDQPLPALRNRQAAQQQEAAFEGAPSPNSDTLGKELRRHGGSNPRAHDVQPRNLNNNPQYKSKFLQQYHDSNDEVENSNGRNQPPPKQPQADPDEVFYNQLRGGDKRSSGPSWNDDTSFAGFDSSGGALSTKRSGAGRTKATRPSVHRTNNKEADDYATGSMGYNPDEGMQYGMPPKVTPRGGIAGQPKLTPRTAGEVKSNLSLLKSKIRQSESAGNPSGTQSSNHGMYGRNTFSSGFDAEEDFDGRGTSNVNRNTSKTAGASSRNSFQNNFGHTDDNYSQPPPEPATRNNRGPAARPRPRPTPPTHNDQYDQDQYQDQQQFGYQNGSQNSFNNVGSRAPPAQGQTLQQRNSRNAPAGNGFSQQPPTSPQAIDDLPAVARSAAPAKSAYNMPSEYPDPDEEEAVGADGPQEECPTCGRKFNPIPFAKHVKICAKVFVQKRKAFDSTKMRIQDNPELVKIYTKSKKEEALAARKAMKANGGAAAPAAAHGGPAAGPARGGVPSGLPANRNGGGGGFGGGFGEEEDFMVTKPKKQPQVSNDQPIKSGAAEPTWKQQSNAFREAMKAARMVTKAQETGAPLPPVTYSAPDPSLIQCPHCLRRFNQKAADRHIPQCQNIQAKPKSLKRGSGVNAASGGPVAAVKGRGRF